MNPRFNKRIFRHPTDSINQVSVACAATVQLDNGCTVTVETPVHRAIPETDENRIAEVHTSQRRTVEAVLDTLNLPADDPRPEKVRTNARWSEILTGACPGTDNVFELIDALAELKAVAWAFDPALGFRGSFKGRTPELKRSGRRGGWEWLLDGEPDCLCPVAAIVEADSESEYDTAMTVNRDPMLEARRVFAQKAGYTFVPQNFTMESAPWGMLVLASDSANLDEWVDEYMPDLSKADRERLEKTRTAITTYLYVKLNPTAPARTLAEPQVPTEPPPPATPETGTAAPA